jgi:hypothetical protein
MHGFHLRDLATICHDSLDGNVCVSQDEEKSWSTAEDIPKGKTVMVIEHPFDNRYVSLFRTFRMTLADVFIVSRHPRSPIARFTTVPKIVERRGALSKSQRDLLSSPSR